MGLSEKDLREAEKHFLSKDQKERIGQRFDQKYKSKKLLKVLGTSEDAIMRSKALSKLGVSEDEFQKSRSMRWVNAI